MAIYKNANLDISVAAEQNPNYNAKPSVQFSTQDKNTAKYTFTVKQNNKPVDLTGVTASVTLFSEDKSVFQSDANITNATEGKIEYVIPADAIRHHGKTRGDLRLTYPNGDVLGGLRFTFNIEQALIDRAAGTVGGVYIRDFETLKAEIQETVDSIKGLDVVRIDSKLNELEQKVEEGGVGVDEQARQEIQEVTERLAEKATQIQYDIIRNNGWKYADRTQIKPAITFVSDDLRKEDLTVLAPIYREKGIKPVGCAIAKVLVEKPHNPIYLTTEEILKLQNEYGWDIESHTYSHLHTAELTDEEIDFELGESFRILNSLGIKARSLVYPYGSYDERVKRIARKYYNCAIRVEGNRNDIPLETYNLRRITFDGTLLEDLKASVRDVIDRKGWGIFMLHPATFDANEIQKVKDLIDYVQEMEVDVLSVQDGLQRFGNAIDIGNFDMDVNRRPQNNYFVVGADGDIYSDKLKIKTEILNHSSIKLSTPVHNWSENTLFRTTFASSDGFPIPNGTVEVINFTVVTPPNILTKQTRQRLYGSYDGVIYERVYNHNTSTWTSFYRVDNYNGLMVNYANDITKRTNSVVVAPLSNSEKASELGMSQGTAIVIKTNTIANDVDISIENNDKRIRMYTGNPRKEVSIPTAKVLRNQWINVPNLPAHTTHQTTISDSDARALYPVLIGSSNAFPLGVTVQGFIFTSGTITISFTNTTTSQINGFGCNLNVSIITV